MGCVLWLDCIIINVMYRNYGGRMILIFILLAISIVASLLLWASVD